MLKYTLIVLVVPLLIICEVKAQFPVIEEEDPIARNWTIDVHYGFPNIFGQAAMSSIEDDLPNQGIFPTDVQKSFINPCGIRLQYRLSPMFNLGGSFIYSRSRMRISDGPQYVELEFRRLRGLVRFELLYNGKTSNKVEYYGALCIGATSWQASTRDNSPALRSTTQNVTPLVPVAIRLVPFGLRYYVNDNIGLHTEIGFGAALLSAGVSGKF